MLVVQGGPGTGKTVVALHRAAYLLYTHRFPLEDQGVLVIGPNRVFLRYIERVLPSLGEAGVEQVVLADLVPGVDFLRPGEPGGDSPEAAKIKGDERMSDVIDNAIRDRERPLREDFVMPFRTGFVRLSARESARIVKNRPPPFPSAQRGTARRRERLLGGARRLLPRSRDRPARRQGHPARHARGPRRARLDVAAAHTGATAARPVRFAGAAQAGRA